MTRHVLVVAGTDSSGGAGLSRDIETIAALGLRSSVAVTAVTVQTDEAVERIEQMPPELIAAQMRAALAANSAGSWAGFVPPPLPPPHKGEGNDFAAVATKIVDRCSATMPHDSPPPCGEGPGVGVPSLAVGVPPPASALSGPIAAIKIGMLGTTAAVEAVASVLASCPRAPVVLDPVLASTSGRALMDSDAIDTLKRTLMPLCRLVTPNLPELALLTDQPNASSEDEIIRQAEMLLDAGATAVLVKGGHATGEISADLLLRPGMAPMRFEAPRVAVTMRGTGCMLASAISAHLARGETLATSIGEAKRFVFDKLQASEPARPER